MTGSAIEGCEEATSPPLLAIVWCIPHGATVTYKGGGYQNAQPYVLPMPMSEEPYFFRGKIVGHKHEHDNSWMFI